MMVDQRGFEPLTPAMRMQCSTTELLALGGVDGS